MTTPLEREILTHYYVMAEPYQGGSENWNPCVSGIVNVFIRMGLLIRCDGRLRANEPALRVYMDTLAAVPLPVQRWVIPEPPPG